MKGRPEALAAVAAISPEPGAYRGADDAPSMLDLVSEVPFPSLAQGKLSTNDNPDKAVNAKFLRDLTRSLPRRTSTANGAAPGGQDVFSERNRK
jgi:hypothetical protein